MDINKLLNTKDLDDMKTKMVLICLGIFIGFASCDREMGKQKSNDESSYLDSEASMMLSDHNFPLIQLPADYQSHRTTKRAKLQPGEEIVVLNVHSPGCVRHIWFTMRNSQNLHLEMYYDNSDQPQVDMNMNHFFGVLLRDQPYRVESAPIKILPPAGLNSYFPIPFQTSCRIIISNKGKQVEPVWSMVDWHRYETGMRITPYRLHAIYRSESPAEKLGSYLVGDISGWGFVAGLFMGVRQNDFDDLIYHTGGDTWLLDGEVNPHVIRGIGGEDIFCQSFGFIKENGQWFGCPDVSGNYIDRNGRVTPHATEGVAYRFYGPDCVRFKSSLSFRVGSNADQMESVLYYYLAEREEDIHEVITPERWTLTGPFECNSIHDFERQEFPEMPVENWPESWQWGNRTLKPVELVSEHAWVDFTRCFRRNRLTNVGTQPVDAAAYAGTIIYSESQRRIKLRFGFDDMLKIWVNGEPVSTFQHDSGMAVEEVPVTLNKGENSLLVKLSNQENEEWRCWAFSCVLVEFKR